MQENEDRSTETEGSGQHTAGSGFDTRGPSEEEVAAWAEAERARREAWAAGPSEEEKAAWARRERRRRYFDPDLARRARRLRRESYLAYLGFWALAKEVPLRAWAQFVDAGRAWEESWYQPTRPPRVPFDEL